MTRSLWSLISVAALLSVGACKDGGKDPADDTDTRDTPEPDTFDTSAELPEVESFSQLLRFGYDATLQQITSVDVDGDEVRPGYYMVIGEQAFFQGSSATACDLWVTWDEPLELADWAGEVDALIAFQAASEDAEIFTNCEQTDFDPADVDAIIARLTDGLFMGWAVADSLDNDVEDALDSFGEDPDEYFGAGFYSMDSEEFDDEGFAETGYATGFVVNADMEAEVDGDSLVPLDIEEYTARVEVPADPDTDVETDVETDPPDTDAVDTDPPATVTITTLGTGYWIVGDIFFYTFQ